MKKCIVISIGLMLLGAFQASAQEIRIRGDVEFTYKYSKIKAGQNYSLETEGKQDGVTMDIRKLKRNSYWAVTVYKSDINWDNSVKIFARRTNRGSGNGYTWGFTNYTRIRNMPQTVMQGYGMLNNIYLQYKLRGISIDLPADTYNTDIIYTLYEK